MIRRRSTCRNLNSIFYFHALSTTWSGHLPVTKHFHFNSLNELMKLSALKPKQSFSWNIIKIFTEEISFAFSFLRVIRCKFMFFLLLLRFSFLLRFTRYCCYKIFLLEGLWVEFLPKLNPGCRVMAVRVEPNWNVLALRKCKETCRPIIAF